MKKALLIFAAGIIVLWIVLLGTAMYEKYGGMAIWGLLLYFLLFASVFYILYWVGERGLSREPRKVKKRKVSTLGNPSDDVYVLRIAHEGTSLCLVYDSLGTSVGRLEGDYYPWGGSHLLGVLTFSVSLPDFMVAQSKPIYMPPYE